MMRVNTENTNTIEAALHCLNKKAWVDPIHKLIVHFEGIPYENPLDDISIELSDILWSLVDTCQKDPLAPIKGIFAIRLARLTCWSYHAHNTKLKERIYWNPLMEPYKNFLETETRITRSTTPNPSDNIIKHYAMANLPE